jgi:hypothetical protein
VYEVVVLESLHSIVFDLKQGYGPLCDFLNVPDTECPRDEPFPYLNAGADLKIMTIWGLFVFETFLVMLPLLVLYTVYRLVSWIAKKRKDATTTASVGKKSD